MDKQTNFWDLPLQDVLKHVDSSPQGLTSEEAEKRLQQYGPNSMAKVSRFATLFEFLHLFTNPLVIILLVASFISMALGDKIDSSIIIAIVMISVLVDFFQEYQAKKAVEALKKQVASTATVLRDGKQQEISPTLLVPGDVIILNAGDVVPADGRLIEEKDVHAHESALTGESFPVEKEVMELGDGDHTIGEAVNSVFLGTNIQTGIATAVVVRTGKNTAFGDIAARLAERAPETEFDRGIRNFGLMISRVTLFLVLAVFLINTAYHKPFMSSFLFAVALAIGLTPELLPVIISVTLAQGARRMAAKKVITKQLTSIENFGSMEILCSDKTGTLTEGDIVLDLHVAVDGTSDDTVMEYLYLNSFFEAGIKSPLDDAILKHTHPCIDQFTKIDEIPFDFNRRRLSVIVQKAGDAAIVITKGEAEGMFDVCKSVAVKSVSVGGETIPFDDTQRKVAADTFQKLSADGYRVLGVAIKQTDVQPKYTKDIEADLTLVGFAAFLDPPKEGIKDTLDLLKRDGINIVIMTGDNQYVTRKVATDVGLSTDSILTGADMDQMDDGALGLKAEQGAIFARVSPEQKNRVITALKARNRVVAFMGDGINDAPSLHAADVGISVANGVDVAKEAANIILLEKDLNVLHDGVIEGRRSFANIMKYIIMGISSNFGNMFSMAAASLFLPFLPMLATQILTNNLLYALSQMAIPTDNVDPELLRTPKRWNVDFIKQFMYIMGPISSIYDFLTFGVLLFWFHANEAMFHTGWFVESLVTQTMVVFVIRTAKSPFVSKPSKQLTASVLGITALAFAIPYLPIAPYLRFVPLPLSLLGIIVLMTISYLALVQVVKAWFYKKHALM
jgi:Mg2+-importing ATPase